MTLEQFNFMVKGKKVIVDFWADWCNPCKVIEPRLVSISEELGVDFVKVNVEVDTEVANAYAVRSLPTVIVLDSSVIKDQIIGAYSQITLNKKIREVFK